MRAPLRPLVDRLWSRIAKSTPGVCWLWHGGKSRSGRREVDYGEIRRGAPNNRNLRAHRLVLMLTTGPEDVPPDVDESFDAWLDRLIAFYRHLEASHTCDISLCCNPSHLEWLTHAKNVADQAVRRRMAEEAA